MNSVPPVEAESLYNGETGNVKKPTLVEPHVKDVLQGEHGARISSISLITVALFAIKRTMRKIRYITTARNVCLDFLEMTSNEIPNSPNGMPARWSIS